MRLVASVAMTMLGFSAIAHAQVQKPGLWEHSTTLHANGGQMAQHMAEMKQQLAALPADQRKAMEQMMGMSVGADGQSMAVKHCVTPEEAAKAALPSHDESCQYTIVQRTASMMKVKFVCADEDKTSGEGEVSFKGDKAYSGQFQVSALVDGKREPMEMTLKGRWLSAQCGSVQPSQPWR